MKSFKVCPKCKGNDILRIPGKCGAHGAGNNIQVHSSFIFGAVLVTRYLCCSCGYSEEWIDKQEDIEKLKERYSSR